MMNPKIGTSPLKKVGPAVPPKPKKPQPQVPKSYQLSGACEPSYSVPLQTAIPETKRPGTNPGPVYSNILPVTEPNDNVYSNIGPTMPMQHLYSNLEPYSKTHIIEDPDAFKTWLASEVKSLIEADPVALAKYIYALVKKNKPLDELREKAVSQLEVFFKEKTVSFVDMLFLAITTKSYLSYAPNVVGVSSQIIDPLASVTSIQPGKLALAGDEPITLVDSAEKITKSEATSSRNLDETVGLPKKRRLSLSPQRKRRWSRSRSRSPRPRSRSRTRSRSRSRSDSWERRNRYLRSPIRKPSYSSRYKRFSSDRKYYSNRRRSWSRSRSRSPFRSRSRSGSYSPRRSSYKHRNPSPLSPLFRKSNLEDKHKLNKDLSSTSVSSAVVTSTEFRYSQKQKCVDFEEKGFCMKGDMCPFDHGVNPVVLEPSSVPLLPIQQTAVPNPQPHQLAVPLDSNPQYNPTSIKTNLSEWVSQKIMSDAFLGQRNESKCEKEKLRGDVFSRLGPRPVKEEGSKCTLEITCIPPKLNTITLLFNHFSKFGNVVNIKINHNDDPRAALVTFSREHEAAAALRNPAPVMRNRFIKVVLQNESSEKEENVPPVPVQTFKIGSKLKKESKPPSLVLRTTNISDQKRKVLKPPIAKKKKMEAKLITANLLKLKQELLEEQIAKQKLLIEKLEKGQHGSEDKNSILATIKILDGSIKEIKSSLANSVSKLKAASSSETGALNLADKKVRLAEVKRELLDAELDLFSAQQKGSDCSEIEKKILSLKKQLLVLDSGGPPVSALSRRPVPVLPKVGSLTIDHRPMKLLIQNFDPQNKGAIVSHISKFGEPKVEQEDDSVPSLILSFKTHKEADLALSKSKQFFGDKITISLQQ